MRGLRKELRDEICIAHGSKPHVGVAKDSVVRTPEVGLSFPGWLLAGWWGFVAGAALIVGAAIGWYCDIGQRFIAGIMAYGSGVLISALSFELMDEAYRRGGFSSTAFGFIAGASVYTAATVALNHHGARQSEGPANQTASLPHQRKLRSLM